MAIRIELFYNHIKQKVEVYADNEECDYFDYLQNKDISSWFEEYKESKLTWRGFVKELEHYLDIPVKNMEFYFYGKEELEKIFSECMQSKGVDIKHDKTIEEVSVELKKSKEFEDGKAFENNEKIEEAKAKYKIAADLGHIQASYDYARLSDDEKSVEYLKKSAENGYGDAQFTLAEYYRKGIYVEQYDREAVYWYKEACNNYHSNAQYQLAKYYSKGDFLNKDLNKAKELFEKSAKAGVVLAWLELGKHYFYNENNNEEAVVCWSNAEKENNLEAQYFLGLCYKHGMGVEVDLNKALNLFNNSSALLRSKRKIGEILLSQKNEEAFLWLNEAVEKEDIPSKIEIIKCYYYGIGVEQNYEKVIELYNSIEKESLDNNKYAQQHFIMGECYINGYYVSEDIGIARDFYEISANFNYTPAKVQLGKIYQRAINNEERNLLKSVEWFEKASQDNDIEAMYFLGSIYENENDNFKSKELNNISNKDRRKKAFEWYEKAGLLGDMNSQAKLGYFYYKEIGVDKWSYEKSAEWYEKAAKQGHAESQFKLADYYYYGHGVKKDKIYTFNLYMDSAKQGHKKARAKVIEHLKHGYGIDKNIELANQLKEQWVSEDL